MNKNGAITATGAHECVLKRGHDTRFASSAARAHRSCVVLSV